MFKKYVNNLNLLLSKWNPTESFKQITNSTPQEIEKVKDYYVGFNWKINGLWELAHFPYISFKD